MRPPTATIRSPESDLLFRLAARQQTHRSAEDQRIGEIAGVNGQGAIDRGNAHAIAVVAHPGNDSLQDAPGVKRAGGKLVQRQVGPSHAEDVGVANRLCAEPGAQCVADHAAQPRVGAAVGVDRRGVIMRFDLEANVVTRRRTGRRRRYRRRRSPASRNPGRGSP